MLRVPDVLLQGLRQFRSAPGFTASSILILAVAIGISTAIFSAVDNVLFQPVPLPQSERLVRLCEVHEGDRTHCTASPPQVADWADRAGTLAAVGVARQRAVTLLEDGRRSVINAAVATPGFLHALGVAPVHGRLLRDDDAPPAGTGHFIVLGYELWRERFGADPGVIGTTFMGSSDGDGAVWHDVPVTIVGVLPPATRAPGLEDVEAWIPFQFDARAEQYRDWRGFVALGRLPAGVTPTQAQAELNRIQLSLARAFPDEVANWSVHAVRARELMVESVRPLMQLFLAAVAFVLLIACVNLMSLQLARATARERELTVRAALGAGNGRLLEQLVVEAGLLAFCGGIGGVVLATWLVEGFVALAPSGVPRVDEIGVDGRALAFTIAVVGAVTLLGGAAPLARLRLLRLHDVLRSSQSASADRRTGRLRRGLVVAQVSLSVGLVLSAGLLMRSFARQAAFDPGFDMAGLLTFQVYPPMERYDSRERVGLFYTQLEQQLAALPGVRAVGTASSAPFLGGGDGRTPFLIAGRPPVALQDAPTVEWYDAGPGFFPALGVAVIAGRNLSEQDRSGEVPTALVNRTMAERYWPGASPVGARVAMPQWETEVAVVGVVEDIRALEATAPAPAIFVSNRQRPRWATFFVVRTAGDPLALAPAIRSTFEAVDSDVEPRAVASMEDRLRAQLVAPRFNLALVALFALLALGLTGFGLYAVIAYSVTLRTREFGIRMALGAHRNRVLRSVLGEGVRLAALGFVGGLLAAAFFGRLLRSLLYGVGPADPIAVAGTVLLLSVTCLVAALVPALRAVRVQPVSVIRGE